MERYPIPKVSVRTAGRKIVDDTLLQETRALGREQVAEAEPGSADRPHIGRDAGRDEFRGSRMSAFDPS